MVAATSDLMREIDRMTIDDYCLPGILLMEHAAIEVVKCVVKHRACGVVTVVCGVGNNGGDGLAVARILDNRGYKVQVILAGDLNRMSADTRMNYEALQHLGIDIIRVDYEQGFHGVPFQVEGIIVDALFGVGCNRQLEGFYRDVVHWMNASSAYTVAVDMPSGIHTDTGMVMGVAVKADQTITFTLPKIGLLVGKGKVYAGSVTVVDIGVPESVTKAIDYNTHIIDDATLALLPERFMDGHKMTYGRLLIIAGSESMSGAGILATTAAYRSGTGLVEVVTHKDGLIGFLNTLPEAIVHTYEDDLDIEKIVAWLEENKSSFTGVLIGPGLGKESSSLTLLKSILALYEGPVVIDADGLNIIARDCIDLAKYQCPIIITPHIGEMSRLMHTSSKDIINNPVHFADLYSRTSGAVVVLKSHSTVITDIHGGTAINGIGNPGMATAGSGDVLAGIIGAMVSQGMTAFEAAKVGVALHSMAGDKACATYGQRGLMASDMIEGISQILKHY